MFIKVYVTTGARKESVVHLGSARYRVAVKEPERGGAANRRVRAVFAERYGVPQSAVRLVSGHHSPSKMLAVDGRALAHRTGADGGGGAPQH